MPSDPLSGAWWECASTPPGAISDAGQLSQTQITWFPASVPGTVAGALRSAGHWRWGVDDDGVLDGQDWWFRCRFRHDADDNEGTCDLVLHGLATVADVWINDEHILRSENMFMTHVVALPSLMERNDLVLRFAAMAPLLAERRPRPRWKSRLLRNQNQRWFRTTLLGRVPGWSRWAAPVGPWRPIELRPRVRRIEDKQLQVTCRGEGGVVAVRLVLADCEPRLRRASLRVGRYQTDLSVRSDAGVLVAEGVLEIPKVDWWWPHTHGDQPLYQATVEIDGAMIELGSVGFRTVEIDRRDDAFTFIVNGMEIFCRGACWGTPDAVSASGADDVRRSLELARDAGLNMLRIPAYTWYEDATFWDACDELGILVWQDCMLAGFDPPQVDAFGAIIENELAQVLGSLQGRPALALVCGSSESYQQAAMLGLPSDRWSNSVLDELIPAALERILPGCPYLASSPSGGDLPFRTSSGVAHYFGVGAYLRPLTDARSAGVRFAAECLAFGTPPERETVNDAFGGAEAAGHSPSWKLAVARDAGTSWDFEDIRDSYVRQVFSVDPLLIRYSDPERALDLGRAVIVELMTGVLSEWRRPASSCAGAIILTWQDLWPGAGWGLIDASGRPKAPWYALRRVLAPTAVLLTDEGLGGLVIHVVTDRPEPWIGTLELTVWGVSGSVSESVTCPIEAPARGAIELGAEILLGGFRDLTRAYRFGPPAADVVEVTLRDSAGDVARNAVYLPEGPARPLLPDIGLRARATASSEGSWSLVVSTELFAQSVAIDIPGFQPADSWFHLAPRSERTILLRPVTADHVPRGWIRALNCAVMAPVEVLDQLMDERPTPRPRAQSDT